MPQDSTSRLPRAGSWGIAFSGGSGHVDAPGRSRWAVPPPRRDGLFPLWRPSGVAGHHPGALPHPPGPPAGAGGDEQREVALPDGSRVPVPGGMPQEV